MKEKVKPLSSILLIITFLFSYSNQVFGQEKSIISAGVGAPELFYVGVRHQSNQTQIGFYWYPHKGKKAHPPLSFVG